MNVSVANFFIRGDEWCKFRWDLYKLGKRTFVIKWLVIIHWSSCIACTMPAPATLYTLDGETLDHLSLHRPYARQVWSATDAGLDFDLALPLVDQGIGEWWTSAVVPLPTNKHKEANSLIMLVLRSLWLERNARVFDRKERPARAVAMSVLDVWRSWISGRGRTNGGLLTDVT
jgi:hypothetical protein